VEAEEEQAIIWEEENAEELDITLPSMTIF